jgi:hypothetical protein
MGLFASQSSPLAEKCNYLQHQSCPPTGGETLVLLKTKPVSLPKPEGTVVMGPLVNQRKATGSWT